MDLHYDDDDNYGVLFNNNTNCTTSEKTIVDIEEELKGPLTIDELNNDVIDCEEEEHENLNEHNTAFVLDIDWNDPRNGPYYDPHDDCVEYPSFLHDNDGYGCYGSNYDGGYDSY